MYKARSVCKDWDFVSKGTELSVGRFLIEYFMMMLCLFKEFSKES